MWFLPLVFGCLLLVSPALADMYQDGSNAKTPEALGNVGKGGGVMIWTPESATNLEINKSGTPPGNLHGSVAAPTTVFKTLHTRNLGTDQSLISYLFHSQVSGDGDVAGVIAGGGASRSFWPGVMSMMNKDGDGSASSFTFSGNLTSSKPGDTGYNEITGIMGTAMNAGSPNGYASGVEVVVGDTSNYVDHFKTGLHAVIGRVHKRDTTYPSTDTKNSNAFMATSEGTVPAGAMFYGYAQPGSPGFYVGLDLHDMTVTSGVGIRLRNNTNIGWMAADAVTDVPALQMSADNSFYVGRGVAQTAVFRPVAIIGAPATTEKKTAVNVTVCHSGVPATVGPVTTEQILAGCTIPGNSIGPNGQLKIWATFNTAGAGNRTVTIKYNGVIVQTLGTVDLAPQLNGYISNNNSPANQTVTGSYLTATSAGYFPAQTGTTANTSIDSVVNFSCKKDVAADTCALFAWRVELLSDGS